MVTFEVSDMTCGHCASAITKAVRAVDAGAEVEVDLGQHLVRIESTGGQSRQLAEAITEAGYTPVPVQAADSVRVAPRPGGCCCGSPAS